MIGFGIKPLIVGVAFLAVTSSSSCNSSSYQPTDMNVTTSAQERLKDAGRALYEETAGKIQVNNDQKQVARYMLDMSKPGTVGYVTVYPPAAGQPIRHFKVAGKVIPCDAQLTPNQHQLWQAKNSDGTPNISNSHVDAPVVDQANDMATYGGKNPKCKFFYTTDDVLVYTDNEVDYTSQPMADEPQPITFKIIHPLVTTNK